MAAEPIAILAADVCLPGADGAEAFWQRIVAADSAIAPLPDDLLLPGRRISGGWFAPLPLKPLVLGMPPKVMRSTERAQLELLHLCKRMMPAAPAVPPERVRLALGSGLDGAMADALTLGLAAEDLPIPSGPAWAGLGAEERQQLLREMADALQARGVSVGEDSAMGQTALYAAGRTARGLDVQGGFVALNAACASSHLAVLDACRWLERGDCDLAIAAAVDYALTRRGLAVFEASGALSPSNSCRPFDMAADGTLLGMGCGAVLLARSRDARERGWSISAEILGGGMSGNGRSGSLTQPSSAAIVAAVDSALTDAGIDFADVRYWEAHGTGTTLGDGEELAAAAACAEAAGSEGLMFGTVKNLIGHTRAASGMAALVKCVLAMEHGVIPPLAHVEEPRPPLGALGSKLRYSERPLPWPEKEQLAAIPALGFGGINACLIVAGPSRQAAL